MKYCTSCGRPMEDTAAFCGACGTPVEITAPPAQPKGRVKDLIFAIIGMGLSNLTFSLATMSLRFSSVGGIGLALAINAFLVPIPAIIFACLAKAVGPRARLIRLFKTLTFVIVGVAAVIACVGLMFASQGLLAISRNTY